MNRQIVRKRVSELTHGKNVRSDLGGEEELQRLGKSLRKRQQTPLLILADGTVVDGNRRLAAGLLEGIEWLDCIVIEGDPSPAEIEQIQLVSAVHRADLSAYDKAAAVRDVLAGNPGMTNRQVADDVLDMDAGQVTRYLAVWSCIPEVQEAAKAGKVGLSKWYAISQAADQAAALKKVLHGATDGDGSPPERVERIRIPLSGAAATGTVTVAGKGGIDLAATQRLLERALKAVKDALGEGVSASTAQAKWRDLAAKAAGSVGAVSIHNGR